MRKLYTTMFILLIQSCSSVNPLSMLSPDKPSIEVNAQIAKNAEQDKSVIKLEQGGTKQTADSISNDTRYEASVVNQITQNMTPFQITVLLFTSLFVGWLLPDPVRVGVAVDKFIKYVFKGVVIYPIKSVANFVLVAMGRSELGNT